MVGEKTYADYKFSGEKRHQTYRELRRQTFIEDNDAKVECDS